MSADNLVRIKQKANGLYQVTHESASSLIHAMEGIEPTPEELLLSVIADDLQGFDTAIKKATDFVDKMEAEGFEVEYGIVGEDWKK